MKMKTNHYVYIVECKYGTYYTGYTNDIEKRITKHNEGKGAKYLKGRRPVKLVWLKKHGNKRSALQSEYDIKKLKREQKKELVEKYGRRKKTG